MNMQITLALTSVLMSVRLWGINVMLINRVEGNIEMVLVSKKGLLYEYYNFEKYIS